MSFLSNWRSDRNHQAPGGSAAGITCRVAYRDELSAATRLILSNGTNKASDLQVVDFLRYALARGIDTGATCVAERDGQILAATLPVPSAGHTMLLLAPTHYLTPDHRAAAAILLDHVLDAYAATGTELAQVLLDPAEQDAANLYSQHGFERLAELLYLQASTRRATHPPALPPNHHFITYSPETHALFARTIAATYEGSLDCPTLAGRRDIEDIVAGHRATGEFDPALWFLLLDRDEPLGVVLLSPAAPSDMMELVYFGLVPAARGKGLGDLLIDHAFFVTHAHPLPQFTLAVDSTNAPALRLYYRHGLRRVHAKVAYMCDLRGKEVRRQKTEARSESPAPAPSPLDF